MTIVRYCDPFYASSLDHSLIKYRGLNQVQELRNPLCIERVCHSPKVQQGAAINQAANNGFSSRSIASYEGHIAVANYLRENGAIYRLFCDLFCWAAVVVARCFRVARQGLLGL
jgi:hypothetical protein